jgi:hypothetical protein
MYEVILVSKITEAFAVPDRVSIVVALIWILAAEDRIFHHDVHVRLDTDRVV